MSIQPQTFAAVYHATGGYGRLDHKALMRATIKRDLAQSGLDFKDRFASGDGYPHELLEHVVKVPNHTWPALVNRLTMDQMRDYLAWRFAGYDPETTLYHVGTGHPAPDGYQITPELAQDALGEDVEHHHAAHATLLAGWPLQRRRSQLAES